MSRKDDHAGTPATETADSNSKTREPERCGCIVVPADEPPFLDERRLAQRLRAACATEVGKAKRGVRLLRGKPANLWDAAAAELRPEVREKHDDGWLEESDVIDEHCNPFRLLTFLWQSIGPMMWDAHIGTCEVAGQLFFTVTTEQGKFVVASVGSGDSTLATQVFLRDYFRTNGDAYGLPLFGGMPTITENHAPDVVVPELLAQCYSDVLRYFEAEINPNVWSDLEETLIAEKAAPDTMTHVLDLLDRCLTDGYLEASESYLTERAAELDTRAKASLLARYLEHSYRQY